MLTLEALFVAVRFQVVRPLVLAYYGALTDVTVEWRFLVEAGPRAGVFGKGRQDGAQIGLVGSGKVRLDQAHGRTGNDLRPAGYVRRVQRVDWGDLVGKKMEEKSEFVFKSCFKSFFLQIWQFFETHVHCF